jgi:hypothetical protein
MKKVFALTILAFLLFTLNTFAQSVTAKVADEQQQPIEYANIQIGPTYNVMSNTEGIFVVNTQNLAPEEKVTISCLGFQSIQLPLSDLKNGTYTLKEQVTVLGEVFISNKKLTPIEILTEVVKNGPKNYAQKPVKQTYFLRTSSEMKMLDNKVELVKASLDKKSALKELNKDLEAMSSPINVTARGFFESYGFLYEQDQLKKLVVKKAIELRNPEKEVSEDQMNNKLIQITKKYLDRDATYKVRSGIIPISDTFKFDSKTPKKDIKTDAKTSGLRSSITSLSSSLNRFYNDEDLDFLTEFKRYTYTLEGYTTIKDETIYIIDFKPARGSADYYGKIYVNAFDFAVVKLDYNLVDGKNIHNINLKLLLGVKMKEDQTKISATFSKNDSGQYAVNFIKHQDRTYMYMNRSLKFTKNKTDKKEETKMIKFDFLMEIESYTTKELFVIDRKPIDAAEFNGITEEKNYTINYYPKYDPSIWKDYNVLAPVEAIKNYN